MGGIKVSCFTLFIEYLHFSVNWYSFTSTLECSFTDFIGIMDFLLYLFAIYNYFVAFSLFIFHPLNVSYALLYIVGGCGAVVGCLVISLIRWAGVTPVPK